MQHLVFQKISIHVTITLSQRKEETARATSHLAILFIPIVSLPRTIKLSHILTATNNKDRHSHSTNNLHSCLISPRCPFTTKSSIFDPNSMTIIVIKWLDGRSNGIALLAGQWSRMCCAQWPLTNCKHAGFGGQYYNSCEWKFIPSQNWCVIKTSSSRFPHLHYICRDILQQNLTWGAELGSEL